jgi:hypothetical protein
MYHYFLVIDSCTIALPNNSSIGGIQLISSNVCGTHGNGLRIWVYTNTNGVWLTSMDNINRKAPYRQNDRTRFGLNSLLPFCHYNFFCRYGAATEQPFIMCCLFFFDIRVLITSLWYLQTLDGFGTMPNITILNVVST